LNRRRVSGSRNRRTIGLQDEELEEKSSLSDSALLITFITVLGYYLAYSYKKGYLSYYGVPKNMISQVDVINIIIASSALFSIIFVPYLLYVNTNTVLYGVNNPIAVIFKNKIIPLIILGSVLLFAVSSLVWIWWGAIGLLASCAWVYISPLFIHSKINGYKNKLEEVIRRDTLNEPFIKKVIRTLKSKSLAKYVLILFGTFYLGNIVYLIGVENAKKEREYIKLEVDNTVYLVVDVIGENYIITPYDKKTNSIKTKFSIIEIKTNFDDLLEFENIVLKDSLKVKIKK